jgi:hypothetical protein
LVRQKWTALKQKSFDADDNTKQQLELFARYCQLFEAILIRVFATDIADLSHVPDNCVSCTNRPLEQLLKWGIESVNKSIHAVTGQMSDRVLVWKSVSPLLNILKTDKTNILYIYCFRISLVSPIFSVI